MRWIKPTPPPQGALKTKSKFLFLPRTLHNRNKEEETRWLERATIVYTYSSKWDMWLESHWIE